MPRAVRGRQSVRQTVRQTRIEVAALRALASAKTLSTTILRCALSGLGCGRQIQGDGERALVRLETAQDVASAINGLGKVGEGLLHDHPPAVREKVSCDPVRQPVLVLFAEDVDEGGLFDQVSPPPTIGLYGRRVGGRGFRFTPPPGPFGGAPPQRREAGDHACAACGTGSAKWASDPLSGHYYYAAMTV